MLPALRLAWGVVALLALIGIAFLGLGWILPGTWQAEAARTLPVEPAQVFPHLADVRAWDAWTPWDGLRDAAGTPATARERHWDDPDVGTGSLRLIEVDPPHLVRYEVQVDGGLSTSGTLRLEPVAGGSRLTWLEAGDFGRNPLLGWFALGMPRMQANEMTKALDRLEALLQTP